MNIKLFYNVPWYMHHDRLEAKESFKIKQRQGEGKLVVGREVRNCFKVLETKLSLNFYKFY